MAEALNFVFEGLKMAQQRKQNESAMKQRQTEAEAEKAHKEEQIKIQQEQLKQQKEQFDVQKKLLEAQVAKQYLDARMSVAQKAVGGEPVPGMTTQPVGAGTQGAAFTPSRPENATSQLYSIPMGEGQQPLEFQAATPRVHAQQQATLEEITNRPKVKAQLEVIGGQRRLMAEQAEASKEADYMRAMAMKYWDDKRNRDSIEGQKEVARLNASSRERAAGIRANAAAGQELENTNVEHYINGLHDGTYTRDDILRTFPKDKRLATNIIQSAAADGSIPISKEQQALVGGYQSLVNNIKLMDEFLANASNTQNRVSAFASGVGNTLNDKLTTLEDELHGRGSIIARGLGQEKGNMSNRDVDRIQRGYGLSRYSTLERNVTMRNTYVNDLKEILDAKLANISPAQRAIIKEKLGLNKIELIVPKGQKQPAQPVQPAYSPESIQLMKKYGIPLPSGVQ